MLGAVRVLIHKTAPSPGPMEFEITHITHYKYGHPAAEAYGEARLTPPNLPTQTVVSHEISLDPPVGTSTYTDHYDNLVAFFSLPFRHDRLVITNTAVVRTRAPELPTESLKLTVQEARQILNSRLAEIFHFIQPTPVIDITREAVQWAKRYLRSDAPLGEALERLNGAIHDEFS